MELAVGTPPVTVQAMVGSSDLCWVECSPCSGCGSGSTPRAAGARLYDRANSSSFSPVACTSRSCKILQKETRTNCTGDAACGYRYVYGATDTDNNYVQGILGTETFTFGSSKEVTMQNFVFGCTNTIYRNDLFNGHVTLSSAYISQVCAIGLGRTNLSLVGQLGLERFSNCLSSNPKVASPILFGSRAQMTGGGISSTPLLYHYMDYSVNLVGISVDGARLPIPNDTFALDPKTGAGGFSFETGAAATLAVDPAYTAVVEAFRERISKTHRVVNGSSLLCFLVDGGASGDVAVPSMTMHFDGMDMELRQKNYFASGKLESGDGAMCLMIGRSKTTSIIGSVMQMDFHVLYDLKNSVLSVQRADCSKI
uniref:Peptidase A1 domain-containing protein n=1 Tax=Oryza brachyantha TaxID=4533 RepID=J3MLK6_ORYBR